MANCQNIHARRLLVAALLLLPASFHASAALATKPMLALIAAPMYNRAGECEGAKAQVNDRTLCLGKGQVLEQKVDEDTCRDMRGEVLRVDKKDVCVVESRK